MNDNDHILVSRYFLERLDEAFEALFEVAIDKDKDEISTQDNYFVCKMWEWVSAKKSPPFIYKETDEEFMKEITTILTDENYEPPYDVEWENLDGDPA